jgi:hypothetical protein
MDTGLLHTASAGSRQAALSLARALRSAAVLSCSRDDSALNKGNAALGRRQQQLHCRAQRFIIRSAMVVINYCTLLPPRRGCASISTGLLCLRTKMQEILGMTNYVAPAYDMWQFGCLMYEAATGIKLFSAVLKKALLESNKNWGYGDQHFQLAAMVNVMGHVPQKVSGLFTAWCIMHRGTAAQFDGRGTAHVQWHWAHLGSQL